MILEEFEIRMKKNKNLVEITVKDDKEITVCGDVHGQYYDVLNIWSINGNPSSENPYLFNGDFVDRGSFSLEIIIALISWKLAMDDCIYLTRGNHEAVAMNRIYGFEGECQKKYNQRTYDIFK